MVLWIIRINSFFFLIFRIINIGDVTGLCFLKNKMSLLSDHVYFLFMECLLISSRIKAFKFRGYVSNTNMNEAASKNFFFFFFAIKHW